MYRVIREIEEIPWRIARILMTATLYFILSTGASFSAFTTWKFKKLKSQEIRHLVGFTLLVERFFLASPLSLSFACLVFRVAGLLKTRERHCTCERTCLKETLCQQSKIQIANDRLPCEQRPFDLPR